MLLDTAEPQVRAMIGTVVLSNLPTLAEYKKETDTCTGRILEYFSYSYYKLGATIDVIKDKACRVLLHQFMHPSNNFQTSVYHRPAPGDIPYILDHQPQESDKPAHRRSKRRRFCCRNGVSCDCFKSCSDGPCECLYLVGRNYRRCINSIILYDDDDEHTPLREVIDNYIKDAKQKAYNTLTSINSDTYDVLVRTDYFGTIIRAYYRHQNLENDVLDGIESSCNCLLPVTSHSQPTLSSVTFQSVCIEFPSPS